MGMYTEMVLHLDLKPDRPGWVDRCIRYFGGLRGEANGTYEIGWPGFGDHPIFNTDRWGHCLSGGAVYQHNLGVFIDERHNVQISASVKNYGRELDHFLDWVSPYVVWTYPHFAGFMRYEAEDDPTLIYWDGGRFVEKYVDYCDQLWRHRPSTARRSPLPGSVQPIDMADRESTS